LLNIKGGGIVMKESEYVNLLKRLILQIKTSETDTEKFLDEAGTWDCPYKERKLLNDLILQAKEFLRIKKIMYGKVFSKDLFEKYLSYSNWFNSINMIVDTFDVPLSKISFSNLSLNEQA
jgi:hypothetical protein